MTVSALGDYRIIKELGRGGMGVVYLAEHQRLLKKYALKILPQAFSEDPQLVERFHNEARVMAELNHPNIVKVVNMSCEGTTYYLVMDYVESETGAPKNLHQLMKEYGGRIPENIAERIVLDVLSALESAHEKGIIHRDIKPANILLDKDGTAKVADFGLVKILGRDDQTATKRVTLTVEGVILGTYDFMSPEQKAGDPVDLRTDIYAVGVIIYSILTGRKPEGRFSLPSEIIPELSPKWDTIVDKCLQNLPEDRFQSAAEVISAIKPKKAPKPEKARKGPKKKKAHRGFLGELLRYGTIVIVVVIIVSAVMTYVMFKDKDFREMLRSTLETALKDEKGTTETQRPVQIKKGFPQKAPGIKPETQVTTQKATKKQVTHSQPGTQVIIPGLEIMGSPEFAEALKKVAAFLEKEGLTKGSEELAEYYKNASSQEKMILDLMLGLTTDYSQYYSGRPVRNVQDFTQIIQEARKSIPDEGPLKDSWDETMKKFDEAREYRTQGDQEKARQSFSKAQAEMRRLTILQATRQQADREKSGLEKQKTGLEKLQPEIKDNLLYQTASQAETDADDAYEKSNFQRAKILYSIAGKILARAGNDCEPAECIKILQNLVESSKAQADRMNASAQEKSLYAMAVRKEWQASSALKDNDFTNAASLLVEAAFFYERAQDRISQNIIIQRTAKRD